MSRTDIMEPGTFLKALGERLDGMTKEEICRVLGRTAGFGTEFESI